MSGEMCNPRCSKSSPVLTANMSSAGPRTLLSPNAELRSADAARDRENLGH